uniref:DUF4371 domain-containing protein n=1 Tax=Amphimedon queenslandica TaxID=400682 RepID=A0A1X7UP18_AMPQE
MVLDSEIVLDTASSSSEQVTTGNALDIAINKCNSQFNLRLPFLLLHLVKRLVLFKRSEPTFTSVGFKDWKHATGQKGILTTHSIGNYYTQAMAAWKDYEKRVATAESIGCQLDRMGSKVISDNRKYVKAVMECILHCVLQGIALHMKVMMNLMIP